MSDLQDIWRGKTDDEIRQALKELDTYDDAAVSVIQSEFARRGIPKEAQPDEATKWLHQETWRTSTPVLEVLYESMKMWEPDLPDMRSVFKLSTASLWSIVVCVHDQHAPIELDVGIDSLEVSCLGITEALLISRRQILDRSPVYQDFFNLLFRSRIEYSEHRRFLSTKYLMRFIGPSNNEIDRLKLFRSPGWPRSDNSRHSYAPIINSNGEEFAPPDHKRWWRAVKQDLRPTP